MAESCGVHNYFPIFPIFFRNNIYDKGFIFSYGHFEKEKSFFFYVCRSGLSPGMPGKPCSTRVCSFPRLSHGHSLAQSRRETPRLYGLVSYADATIIEHFQTLCFALDMLAMYQSYTFVAFRSLAQ